MTVPFTRLATKVAPGAVQPPGCLDVVGQRQVGAPVVPVVPSDGGDTTLFRFGNTGDLGIPYTDVELRSGNTFVLGGPSRSAYQGVRATYPVTTDPSAGIPRGRLNITMRVTGVA